jgi:hypothetical protein
VPGQRLDQRRGVGVGAGGLHRGGELPGKPAGERRRLIDVLVGDDRGRRAEALRFDQPGIRQQRRDGGGEQHRPRLKVRAGGRNGTG